MKFDPNIHHRRSIRLKDYDYSLTGAYFVTICTDGRMNRFGTIADTIMYVNDLGQIVIECWNAIPAHFHRTELDAFVVMPNHIHGIIVIVDNVPVVGAQQVAPLQPQTQRGVTPNNVVPGSLGAIVRAFKGSVSRRINTVRGTPALAVWQRNYHEHIIRDEQALNYILQYVYNNPATWEKDSQYSEK